MGELGGKYRSTFPRLFSTSISRPPPRRLGWCRQALLQIQLPAKPGKGDGSGGSGDGNLRSLKAASLEIAGRQFQVNFSREFDIPENCRAGVSLKGEAASVVRRNTNPQNRVLLGGGDQAPFGGADFQFLLLLVYLQLKLLVVFFPFQTTET